MEKLRNKEKKNKVKNKSMKPPVKKWNWKIAHSNKMTIPMKIY